MTDVARYATVELSVTGESKELRIPQLLHELGLSTQTQECFWVIAYDAALNVRSVIEVARGTYSRVKVHLPAIYTAVLMAGTDRFMVAHNHPTGETKPTQKDIDLTVAIMRGANSVGLYFEDHIIVTSKRGFFSFQQAGLLFPADYTAEQEAAVR